MACESFSKIVIIVSIIFSIKYVPKSTGYIGQYVAFRHRLLHWAIYRDQHGRMTSTFMLTEYHSFVKKSIYLIGHLYIIFAVSYVT